MEEKEAIELLSKLEKFMKDTTQAIKDLQIKVFNQQVDISQLKKLAGEKKIILPH